MATVSPAPGAHLQRPRNRRRRAASAWQFAQSGPAVVQPRVFSPLPPLSPPPSTPTNKRSRILEPLSPKDAKD
jgi:hypothetical protein